MIAFFDVTKTFGPHVVALDQINLQIEECELVIVTGPSGAGKTTLLRTIVAAEQPDHGRILLAGRNIARLQKSSLPFLRRNIGFVFQDFKLIENQTTFQNVALALEIRGVKPKEIQNRTLEALRVLHLEHLAKTKVQNLSGGEQQRVAITRAIVGNPTILVADEPTGNLDPEHSHNVLELFDAFASKGNTVIVATHDPMVVDTLSATRIIRIEAGRIISSQTGPRTPIRVDKSKQHINMLPLKAAEVPT